ncbi:MAG: alpha/beta fold hydrolase, partial [Pseudomonadota bacterium]
MKTLLTTAALTTALFSTTTEAAVTTSVSFEHAGQTLAADLYLPDNYQPGDRLPGVVVTGAWTTVKEQMAGTYAAELANRGYAALAFDFRGWGASPDTIQFLEDPSRKTDDIRAAAAFLATRPEVDSDRVAGLGICASAGYMSDAALDNPVISSVALVAPWLHDAEIVNAVYGGEAGVAGLIEISRQAERSIEPMILEA